MKRKFQLQSILNKVTRKLPQEIPIKISSNEEILGNRELKEITWVVPLRIKHRAPLMRNQ